MEIGIVVGTVTATRKDESLVGAKMLVTQPIGIDEQPVQSQPIITVDTVGAGVGEKVIFVKGSIASRACDNYSAPVDAAIVGIIDILECDYGKG
ncbi:EutN/CcmL family microcompartment protein [Natribacillus halophilus]|uniref:Ethanolamine utilization protein EutN n=1 Tax=Natribacillus halophilus TaxID=549003 RepID=A0A1G8N0G1_9BACI|nr:EutN/CcmL family microcompartment protein [Natribacillus halophilus]SDI73575.1 ethanolamine utilization protein EutN [Natribacillus halophilus]